MQLPLRIEETQSAPKRTLTTTLLVRSALLRVLRGVLSGPGSDSDLRICKAILYAVRDRSFATHCSVEVAVLGLAAVVCVYQSGEAPGLPRGQTDAFQGMNGGCLLF